MSEKLNIDVDAIADAVSTEARAEYSSMWKKLKEDQRELFDKITKAISREYLAYTFGPPEDKPKREENLRSLKNGLAALEGVVSIRVYRTTVNLVGRVLGAIIKQAVKSAIGL